MIRNLIILFHLTFFIPIFSQIKFQKIIGIVLDKETRLPIINATVFINKENANPIYTDSFGQFFKDSNPIGRVTIYITHPNFEPWVQQNLVLNSAKELIIDAELDQTIVLSTVRIQTKKVDMAKTNNDMVLISGRQFSTDQTSRYAGSLLDPSRMATNFAGVNAGGGQRNDIIVRGNSPIGLLWRLDGVDIPNPNHFSSQGATGGPVSILNNNNLANSDFLTSAFPAEYGNAVGAVFDLRMRNGNYNKFEFTGQVGFNGFEFGAEGPISKKNRSSFMANYRYSTLGAFDALGINLTFNGIPKYQDFTVKLNFPKTKFGEWAFTSIGGISSIQLLDSKKDTTDLSFGFGAPNNLSNGSGMLANILTNTHKIKNGYIKCIALYSIDNRFTQFDTIDKNKKTFLTYAENSNIHKAQLHAFINKRLTNKVTMRSGILLTHQRAKVKDSVFSESLNRYRVLRNYDGAFFKHQFYTQFKIALNNKLTANLGLHHQYVYFNNSLSFEPRAALSYKTSSKSSINFGYGFHAQQQPTEIYFAEFFDTFVNKNVKTNKNLGLTKSNHFVLGYDYIYSKALRLKIETYYQQVNNVPISLKSSFSLINLGAEFGGLPAIGNLTNNGKGTNYGIELTLERFFTKNFYYLITTSIYDSKYTDYKNVKRNTAFNSNYVTNALAGYELQFGKKQNKVLSFNFKNTIAGGRRYTPIDIAKSKAEYSVVFDELNPYGSQFKTFIRTDFKISFKLNGKRATQEWSLDIQNLFDTKNPVNVTYNRIKGTETFQNQQGRLPMLFYRIQF